MWVRKSPKGLLQEQVGRVGAAASSSEPCRAAMDFQFFLMDKSCLTRHLIRVKGTQERVSAAWQGKKRVQTGLGWMGHFTTL